MCRWPPHPSQPYFGWHNIEQFQVMLSGETTSETTGNQPGHPPGACWPMALNQSLTLGTCQGYQPPPVPRCYCFPTHNNIPGSILRVIQKNTLKIISSEKALILPRALRISFMSRHKASRTHPTSCDCTAWSQSWWEPLQLPVTPRALSLFSLSPHILFHLPLNLPEPSGSFFLRQTSPIIHMPSLSIPF